MVHGSSLVHFARGLAARKYFTYRDVMGFVYAQAKFQLTGRENSEDVAEGKQKALAFIEGRSTAELEALGEEIYDEFIADKIWPGTRDLAQMHLDAGQQVWLVTATPYELAATIARRLGLTGALGTVAESVDGVFTGRLVGEILHGAGKAHAVRALAIREGLNLRRCTAYSDSYNDVPMLTLVGTAVAINPDADLRDVARERGWEIRDSAPCARRPGSACPRRWRWAPPVAPWRPSRRAGADRERRALTIRRGAGPSVDRLHPAMAIAEEIIGTHYRFPDQLRGGTGEDPGIRRLGQGRRIRRTTTWPRPTSSATTPCWRR